MDKLYYYSKSADKYPGKGANEYIKNNDFYKKLLKYQAEYEYALKIQRWYHKDTKKYKYRWIINYNLMINNEKLTFNQLMKILY